MTPFLDFSLSLFSVSEEVRVDESRERRKVVGCGERWKGEIDSSSTQWVSRLSFIHTFIIIKKKMAILIDDYAFGVLV